MPGRNQDPKVHERPRSLGTYTARGEERRRGPAHLGPACLDDTVRVHGEDPRARSGCQRPGPLSLPNLSGHHAGTHAQARAHTARPRGAPWEGGVAASTLRSPTRSRLAPPWEPSPWGRPWKCNNPSRRRNPLRGHSFLPTSELVAVANFPAPLEAGERGSHGAKSQPVSQKQEWLSGLPAPGKASWSAA